MIGLGGWTWWESDRGRRLQRTVDEHTDELDAHEAALGEHEKRLDSHDMAIETNRTRIAEESQENDDQSAAITRLESADASQTSELRTLQEELKAQEQRLLDTVGSLTARLEALEKGTAADQEEMAELRRRVADLEAERKAQERRLRAIEDKLGIRPQP